MAIKNIVVIGGGPAGLEASAQLHNLGYNVFLIEKNDKLGGHLGKWDRLFPQGIRSEELLNPLIKNIAGVKTFVNTEVVSINKLEKQYNIILSNGITILAHAVLFATGFDLFPASKKEEYGYGIYDKVITNADLEIFFRTKSDSRIVNPLKIGFVHCVGSRDEKIGNRQCSKVCCATAVKQACEIKEVFPNAEVICFYIDLRMFGRKYEDLYLTAQKKYGVRFIRGRVSEVGENINHQLIVKAEDTLSAKPLKVTLDLLVLMCGMNNSSEGIKTASLIGLKADEDGFFETLNPIQGSIFSHKKGIFYAGAATGPKTLPETINEGRAAAICINNYIKEEINE